MTDKTWLITGSSRGLGRAIAQAALVRGDRVVATARNPHRLADLAEAYPEQVLPLALDVTDAAAAAATVATAEARFGRLDVLVNNAGYATLSSIEDTPAEDFRAQVETNLFGVVTLTQAVLPLLRRQGAGHIITVSSVGGRVGTPGLGAYQAAKWAVNGFTEVLAAEVAPLGIKVSAIEPGGMQTEWAGASMAIPPVSEPYRQTVGAVARLLAAGPQASLGDPAKVAQIVLQLSDLDQPPVRLLLGSDALNTAAAAAAALAERDAAWAELSRSTDRADATAEQRDPLGTLRR